MSGIKKLSLLAFSFPFLAVPFLHAAEFEVLDRFSVDGYTVLRGSADIPGGLLTVGASTFVVKSGNVGIGTTNPGAKLEVQGGRTFVAGIDATNNNSMRIMSTAGSDVYGDVGYIQIGYAAFNQAGLQINASGGLGFWTDSGGWTQKIALTNAGNVGIGTTAPNVRLEVKGSDIRLSDPAGVGILNMVAGTASAGLYSNYYSGSDIPLHLGTYINKKAVTIQAATGNVGIGTTNPADTLQVIANGYVGIRAIRYQTDSGPSYLNMYHARGTEAAPLIQTSGDHFGLINFGGYDGAGFQSGAAIAGRTDGTPGAADMPGRLEFQTTPDGSAALQTRMTIKNDGNIGIGTTGPKTALDVNGLVRVGRYTAGGMPTCNSDTLGSFAFDTTNDRPYTCASTGWKPLDSDYDKDGIVDWNDWDDTDANKKNINLTAANIKKGVEIFGITGTFTGFAISCKAIMDSGSSTGDGTYVIDTTGGDSSDEFTAYCDMSTDGGGWTLVYRRLEGVTRNLSYNYVYDSAPAWGSDYSINRAKYTTAFTEILLANYPDSVTSIPDNATKISNFGTNYYTTAYNSIAGVSTKLTNVKGTIWTCLTYWNWGGYPSNGSNASPSTNSTARVPDGTGTGDGWGFTEASQGMYAYGNSAWHGKTRIAVFVR